MILAQGGKAQGYALHLEAGKPVFSVRNSGKLSTAATATALAAGIHEIRAELAADGAVTITVDGARAGEGRFPGLLARKPGEGLTVGDDGKAGVGEYAPPHAFSGKVTRAAVTVR